ncbi:MerR family DNA-binding transcriptional regulator [Schnuerera sp. xch1]|uniref:MerR family transcriptional regulator n=1 Tax=Schnuerera sp. xch1 TaxID=2874283 RepID=UPI001CBF41E1|nr:MerR family transcriptional regulator [Schnuerera sp. xch1]MBZ2174675.1 MerR family DNA-binding transcriptional regulator [Schnuerera sp. xch1]
MAIRPVDIARKLNISTTTLRKYEEFGLTPPVPRSESGYRLYSQEHVAYFICAREMIPAFTMKEIAKIFEEVMAKRIEKALWMVNKSQAKLHSEKLILGKMVKNLLNANNKHVSKIQYKLTINELSKETGIPITTIRYWDKVGLISASRSKNNNYRLFTQEHIKQVLLIYALKYTVYSKYGRYSIEKIRQNLETFDYADVNRITTIIDNIETYLSQINRAQISGISALYRLCVQVETNNFDNLV